MFIENRTITLIDDEAKPASEQNIMVLRERLTLAQDSELSADAQAIQRERGGQPLSFTIWQVLLLKHRLVSWRGPAFAGVPCTPEHIMQLDPSEPLVKQALARALRLHFPGLAKDEEEADEDAGPKDPTPPLTGSLTAGDGE